MAELRVALVHPYAWPEVRRGGERYVEDLAVFLAGHGVDVEVVAGTHGGASVQRRPDGVTVRRLRHVLGHRLRRWQVTEVETFGLSAWLTLAHRRYDVVHAMTPTAAIAARAAGRPTVYTVIGHPTREQLAHRPYDARVFGRAVRGATVPAALSRASADQVEVLFHRPAEVLTPGVWTNRFVPNLAARTGPPRILFSAAAGDRRKGLDVAVAAHAMLLGDHPDARLVVSGEGDTLWAFETVADTETRARVRAATDLAGAGTVDEVPERYRQATVTLLPSVDEAFGIVLVESLASGTPVVCAASGGMPEIVDDPRVGVVVDRTADAVAAGVRRAIDLARGPETPSTCVAHATRWDWDQTVGPAHLELYRRVAR